MKDVLAGVLLLALIGALAGFVLVLQGAPAGDKYGEDPYRLSGIIGAKLWRISLAVAVAALLTLVLALLVA